MQASLVNDDRPVHHSPMAVTRLRLLLALCPALACGPGSPLATVDTSTTDVPATTTKSVDASSGAPTSGAPGETGTSSIASSSMGDTTATADTAVPDLPPEPPVDNGLYHGDAPGCGDGVPEAGVYCFESRLLADRIWIPGIADFDGDGHLDVMWLKYDGTTLQRGDGQGNLGPEAVLFEEVDDVYNGNRLLPVDLDQDGDLDVVRDGFIDLRLLFNDGQGNFTEGPTIAAETWFDFATVADLDLDGDPELVAGEDDNGTPVLSVFQFMGDGVDRVSSVPIAGCDLNGLTIAHLDPDPLPDLVAVGRQCDRMPGVQTPVVSLLNGGALSFAAFGDFPASMNVGELVSGDWDADGRVDVAAAAYFDGDIRVLLGLGDGGLAPQIAVGPAQPMAGQPYEMFTAELDGFPGSEVAYAVYRTVGDFDFEVTLAVLMDPADPAVEVTWIDTTIDGTYGGDFNEDGITDLIYTHFSYDPVADQIHNDLKLLMSAP